ncbi:hypothetical protein [Mycobacterium sp. AT1]|uniref:hypothetical protein n=1 Tax=Mycobacterium sp. AT1 TaxID=1961706 RepID=UPI0009ABE6B4|nr:hypothetical protein [Mycobacterium sp. AT1]OPX10182.1 hypothetical protein B1790_13410 [Mycobacterium sp. AT1]
MENPIRPVLRLLRAVLVVILGLCLWNTVQAKADASGGQVVGQGTWAQEDGAPADDPCQLAVSFLCRFMPIAPDLDHNLDLTRLQPTGPGAPLPEDLPLPDVCAFGCV